jgi:hypothetical protein
VNREKRKGGKDGRLCQTAMKNGTRVVSFGVVAETFQTPPRMRRLVVGLCRGILYVFNIFVLKLSKHYFSIIIYFYNYNELLSIKNKYYGKKIQNTLH